ncbi:MAG TPA: ABC transporter permease [Methylomirabilota bacterium]|jgi:peptide/nickel transport system permease protein|nr:ABC transporter permease [Methylomirabilota bacterium]HEV8672988.1 ABC transporter permease [Methylomirabilota bacterium]
MHYRDFLVRRLAQIVPTILGLLVLIFLISRVMPGDPVRLALGPEATHDQIEAYRHKLGLDQPLPVQFAGYLGGLARGDFGESIRTYRDVRLDLRDFLPATVELVLAALVVAVALGVPLGVLSAVYRDTWVDNLTRLFAVPGVALPRFWVGIVLQIGLAYQLGLFPIVGRASRAPAGITGFYLLDALLTGDTRAFLDSALHLALPAVTLALPTLAQLARITRASMIDVFRRQFMLVHRAYGIRPARLVMRYGLRNGLTSVLTLVGMTYGALLENAFLVEVVFSWPGISAYGAAAVLAKDFNAVVGVTLVVGLSFMLANFLVDVLYGFVDPRVRYH